MALSGEPPGRLERLASIAGVALIVLSLLALVGLWALDHARRWETPRWERAAFTPLREPPRAAPDSAGTWAVLVQPDCPHCRRVLASLAAERRRGAISARLAVLLIDLPRRPDSALVAGLGAEQVWWDARGVWRRRWGLRTYGQVLRFDAAGRYLGVAPGFGAGP